MRLPDQVLMRYGDGACALFLDPDRTPGSLEQIASPLGKSHHAFEVSWDDYRTAEAVFAERGIPHHAPIDWGDHECLSSSTPRQPGSSRLSDIARPDATAPDPKNRGDTSTASARGRYHRPLPRWRRAAAARPVTLITTAATMVRRGCPAAEDHDRKDLRPTSASPKPRRPRTSASVPAITTGHYQPLAIARRHVDAHGQGDLLIVGDGPERQPRPAPSEQPAATPTARATTAGPARGDEHALHREGLRRDGQPIRP
jgi:hypothetical protein